MLTQMNKKIELYTNRPVLQLQVIFSILFYNVIANIVFSEFVFGSLISLLIKHSLQIIRSNMFLSIEFVD